MRTGADGVKIRKLLTDIRKLVQDISLIPSLIFGYPGACAKEFKERYGVIEEAEV